MFWGRKKSFAGRHVAITGGSEGLGLALAKLFVLDSAHVTIIARTASKLDAACAELLSLAKDKGVGSKVQRLVGDVTDFATIQAALQKAESDGGCIDVLVCCAGACTIGHFTDLGLDVFERTMRLNYMGAVNTMKAVLPGMESRDSGLVVVIASAMAVVGMSCNSSYAPTKWALRGLTDCLRMEYQGTGVEFCIAYPPDTDTPGLCKTMEGEAIGSEARQLMALGGETFPPEVVAAAIMRGLKRGEYHLPSPDLLQTLSQSSMTGLSPTPFWPPVQMLVTGLLVPVYAVYTRLFDGIVKKARKERKKTSMKKVD